MNKIGRNARCPCGSGLKFKKCCLNKTSNYKSVDSHGKQKSKSSYGYGLKNPFSQKAIQNPSKHYILSANLKLRQDYIRIEGIHVRGDVSLDNSKGIQLTEMNIQSRTEDGMAGNINIGDSNEFILSKNIVANDINIGSKNIFQLDRNLVGYSFEDAQKVIDALNVLLVSGSNKNKIEDSLHTIQKAVSKNKELSTKIGEVLYLENRRRRKTLSSIVLSSLKTAGISTLKAAQSKGLDLVIMWLIKALEITLEN